MSKGVEAESIAAQRVREIENISGKGKNCVAKCNSPCYIEREKERKQNKTGGMTNGKQA